MKNSTIDTSDFFRAVIFSVLSLGVSAILILSVFLAVEQLYRWRTDVSGISHTLKYSDKDLILKSGLTVADDGSVRSIRSVDGRVLLTRQVYLQADRFAFVDLDVGADHASTFVYFLWRNVDSPELYNIPLHRTPAGTGITTLLGHKHWKGLIGEVGLDIYFDQSQTLIQMKGLQLRSNSPLTRLQAISSQWRRHSPWTQRSVNTESANASQFAPLTIATVVWLGIALMLIWVMRFWLSPMTGRLSAMLALVIVWLAVDSLWTQVLWKNAETTRSVYQDKEFEQKHISAEDALLYASAQSIKRAVSDLERKFRVFLVKPESEDEIWALRYLFHLLPLNAALLNATPPKKSIANGDYLIYLGKHEVNSPRLAKHCDSLQCEKVREDGLSILYRVLVPGGEN